ncbi:MAG: hypothetical protein J7J46_09695, partial [Candidatus Desulfofervidus sp.]|nr:hypothetical protein [Candidatus Desulfofervidus sp.]
INKESISPAILLQLLKQLKIEEVASKINLSEEEIWKLSEEVKKDWFEREGKKILKEKGIL